MLNIYDDFFKKDETTKVCRGVTSRWYRTNERKRATKQILLNTQLKSFLKTFSSNQSWIWMPILIVRNTLYQKSDLCISRNETAQPRSQFLHSSICERFIYSWICPPIWLQQNRQTDPMEIHASITVYECENWETEHYNSVLEVRKPRSFISGNR